MAKLNFDLIASEGGPVDLVMLSGDSNLQDKYGLDRLMEYLNHPKIRKKYDAEEIKHLIHERLERVGVPDNFYSINGPQYMQHTVWNPDK